MGSLSERVADWGGARWMDLSSLPWRRSTGVRSSNLVSDETGARKMDAALVGLASDGVADVSVPEGSDRYLFTIAGQARLAGPDGQHVLGPQAFATLREGDTCTLIGSGEGTALVLSVTAPPPGVRGDRPGSRGGTAVVYVPDLPIVEERESGKGRIYLVTKDTTGSQRTHAMIVTYKHDTVTPEHYHPDADSLFVFLKEPGLYLWEGAKFPYVPVTPSTTAPATATRCAVPANTV